MSRRQFRTTSESCTEYGFQSAKRVARVETMFFILLRYDCQPDP